MDPEPTRPAPDSAPPCHDPWASTVPLSGASPTEPSPTLPMPPSPMPASPIPAWPAPGAARPEGSGVGAGNPGSPGAETPTRLADREPGYPPVPRYPYPGLASMYSGGPGAYSVDEPVIARIGDIQVTATTVRTPAGTFPLRGSQWTVTDQWTTEQRIPTWAIILSIALFFCIAFFSLLFLLARESTYRGVVQVYVMNGPHQYVARIPVTDQSEVQYLYQQVNYVRSLATI